MTTPVTLYGTQSNGETLPVQVDEFGRLVAEGLQGSEGQQGPKGDKGDKGDPGEPGADGSDGADGVGVPTPYGEEGSYLRIKDGVPAWTEGTDPTPEPPASPVTMLPSTQIANSSTPFDEFGVDASPQEDLDGWIKSQPIWSTPAVFSKNGVGSDQLVNYQTSSKFRVENCLGDVLHVDVCAIIHNQGIMNMPVAYEHSISTQSTNVQSIRNKYTWETNVASPGTHERNDRFSFLCSRDSFEVEFVHKLEGQWVDTSKPVWIVVNRFEIERAESFLMNQYVNQQKKLDELSKRLREAAKDQGDDGTG